jgi:hypothetical protein
MEIPQAPRLCALRCPGPREPFRARPQGEWDRSRHYQIHHPFDWPDFSGAEPQADKTTIAISAIAPRMIVRRISEELMIICYDVRIYRVWLTTCVSAAAQPAH